MPVLVVHDDHSLRDAVAVALRIRGLDVDAFAEVGEALACARRKPPVAFLIAPALVLAEKEPLRPRVEANAGCTVRVVALTDRAATQKDLDELKRHGAALLASPLDDIERVADSLERLEAANPSPRPRRAPPAPWETPPARTTAPPPIAVPAIDERAGGERGAGARREAEGRPSAIAPTVAQRPAAAATLRGSGLVETDLFGDTADIPMAPARWNTADDVFLARAGEGAPILVVDDDPTFRFLLCDLLSAKGYSVYTSINASNALRFLKGAAVIDLIISDVNMPHMDGFELKYESDQVRGTPIPFIAVTAAPTADKAETARKVGCVAMLSKPLEDLDKFYALVERALRRSSS